jgi:hypothetical protein
VLTSSLLRPHLTTPSFASQTPTTTPECRFPSIPPSSCSSSSSSLFPRLSCSLLLRLSLLSVDCLRLLYLRRRVHRLLRLLVSNGRGFILDQQSGGVLNQYPHHLLLLRNHPSRRFRLSLHPPQYQATTLNPKYEPPSPPTNGGPKPQPTELTS